MTTPPRSRTVPRLLLLLFLLACTTGCHGCGAVEPPTPQAIERAYAIVWEGVYNMPRAQRPPVVFHTHVECTDANGNAGIKHSSTGLCLEGWAGQTTAHVLYLGDLARTSFAHELYHFAYFDSQPPWLQSIKGMDQNHETEGWGTVVPQAEAALADGGAQ